MLRRHAYIEGLITARCHSRAHRRGEARGQGGPSGNPGRVSVR